jgi:hypothetical protein
VYELSNVVETAKALLLAAEGDRLCVERVIAGAVALDPGSFGGHI